MCNGSVWLSQTCYLGHPGGLSLTLDPGVPGLHKFWVPPMMPRYHNCTKFGGKMTISPDPPKKLSPGDLRAIGWSQHLKNWWQWFRGPCSTAPFNVSRWADEYMMVFLYSYGVAHEKQSRVTLWPAQLLSCSARLFQPIHVIHTWDEQLNNWAGWRVTHE